MGKNFLTIPLLYQLLHSFSICKMSELQKRLLPEADDEEQEFYYDSQRQPRRSCWSLSIWQAAGILLSLLLTNLITASFFVVKFDRQSVESDAAAPAGYGMY